MESESGIIRVDRREQLLRAAAELFAERGYATTSIDAIGDRAGVTGPAVYRHFPSKRDILLTLLSEAVNVALSGAEERSLDALVTQVVRYSITRRRVTGLLYAQHGKLAPADRAKVDALKDRVREIWSGAVREARPDMAEEEVLLRVGATISVLSTIGRQLPEHLSGNEEAIYIGMIRTLLTGD